MISAKVRFGHIGYDCGNLVIHHKSSAAGHTDSTIPVHMITGVSKRKFALGPTIVEFRVPGAPRMGTKNSRYMYGFSFRARHAKQVHAVLAAAGIALH